MGYFQEELEVEQSQGSGPDRIILTTNVEEKPTGELSLSAGFSSIENFIFQGSIKQRNFRGKGQELRDEYFLFVLFEIRRNRLYRALSFRPFDCGVG